MFYNEGDLREAFLIAEKLLDAGKEESYVVDSLSSLITSYEERLNILKVVKEEREWRINIFDKASDPIEQQILMLDRFRGIIEKGNKFRNQLRKDVEDDLMTQKDYEVYMEQHNKSSGNSEEKIKKEIINLEESLFRNGVDDEMIETVLDKYDIKQKSSNKFKKLFNDLINMYDNVEPLTVKDVPVPNENLCYKLYNNDLTIHPTSKESYDDKEKFTKTITDDDILNLKIDIALCKDVNDMI